MFKDYIKYRKDCKVAKREFTKMAVTTLPLINKLTKKSSEIGNFLLNSIFMNSSHPIYQNMIYAW